MLIKQVPPEDREKQKSQFKEWFGSQNRYTSIGQMGREIGIPRATLRGYYLGDAIARGKYRRALHSATGLDCFAPHPIYDEETPGPAKKTGAAEIRTRRAKPASNHSSTFVSIDEAVRKVVGDGVAENMKAVVLGIEELLKRIEQKLDRITSEEQGWGTGKSSRPEPAVAKPQPIIHLPQLPQVDLGDEAINATRRRTIELTRLLASYSNLTETSGKREKVRQALLDAVQQLFIVILLFDKQYPSDFTAEAERFRILLNIH